MSNDPSHYVSARRLRSSLAFAMRIFLMACIIVSEYEYMFPKCIIMMWSVTFRFKYSGA